MTVRGPGEGKERGVERADGHVGSHLYVALGVLETTLCATRAISPDVTVTEARDSEADR